MITRSNAVGGLLKTVSTIIVVLSLSACADSGAVGPTGDQSQPTPQTIASPTPTPSDAPAMYYSQTAGLSILVPSGWLGFDMSVIRDPAKLASLEAASPAFAVVANNLLKIDDGTQAFVEFDQNSADGSTNVFLLKTPLDIKTLSGFVNMDNLPQVVGWTGQQTRVTLASLGDAWQVTSTLSGTPTRGDASFFSISQNKLVKLEYTSALTAFDLTLARSVADSLTWGQASQGAPISGTGSAPAQTPAPLAAVPTSAPVTGQGPVGSAAPIQGMTCDSPNSHPGGVKARVSLSINDAGDVTLPSPNVGALATCNYWVYSDASGGLVVDAPAGAQATLGGFITIWRLTAPNDPNFVKFVIAMSGASKSIAVNGHPVAGDKWQNMALTDGMQIVAK